MVKRCAVHVGSDQYHVELGDLTWHSAGSLPCAKCGCRNEQTAHLLVTDVIDPRGIFVPKTSQAWDTVAIAFRRSDDILSEAFCASCLSPLV